MIERRKLEHYGNSSHIVKAPLLDDRRAFWGTPLGGGGTSTGKKLMNSFGKHDYAKKDLINYEITGRKRKIRSTRDTPLGGSITQACASRMNGSNEWRHEGVSVDLDGVHSGFPKDFRNFGLDLSIFPESHARGGTPLGRGRCKGEYGIDSFGNSLLSGRILETRSSVDPPFQDPLRDFISTQRTSEDPIHGILREHYLERKRFA